MNNNFNIGSFDAGNAAVNLGGTITGNQIGTQTNYTFPDLTQTDPVTQVSQLLQDIHEKYPQASDAEILDMIEKGFETMRQENPQKWQGWVDLLNVVFAGGVEGIKIWVPPSAILIEVAKKMYEIYDCNRKKLPGN